MASKRDLVEAHSFNRRRLVTAFLSGAPGGREVEPVRYGRTLIGGLVLAALLVAGAAVSGALGNPVDKNWRSEDGLVVAEQSGSRFIVQNKNLYPIVNITSARLIVAKDGELPVRYIPDDVLADVPKGAAVGISGAPDFLTPRSNLVQSGWTACTNDQGGLQTALDSTPAARPAGRQALLVKQGDATWLVDGDRRYEVPKGDVSQSILRGLRIDETEPFAGSSDWLGLVREGSRLAPITIPGSGSTVDLGNDELTTVGTPIEADGAGYVLGRKGLIALDDFAYGVYRATSDIDEAKVSVADVQGIPTQDADGLVPADWPTDTPTPFSGDAPCLLLQPGQSATDTSEAVLATPRSSKAVPTGEGSTLTVEQGRGALVASTSRETATGADSTFLVDSRGTRFAVGPKGSVDQTRTALGYGEVTPRAVPRAWVDLFSSGPELTPQAAIKAAS